MHTYDKRAPVGIGRAHYSGEDMYMSGMRGKCLDMLHVLEDSLWAFGDKSIKMPLIPSPIQAESSDEKSENETDDKQILDTDKLSELKLEDLEETSGDKLSDEQAVAKDGQEESTEPKDDEESKQEDEKEEGEAEIDHERLLVDSFLCAAKFKSKEFKLPVIVSTFMKVMQSCW